MLAPERALSAMFRQHARAPPVSLAVGPGFAVLALPPDQDPRQEINRG
jgi:hypothetical protein